MLFVLYVAADARLTDRSRRQGAGEQDLSDCLVELQTTCQPFLEFATPGKDPMSITLRSACDDLLEFDRCVTRILDNVCSDDNKQILMMLAGRQMTASQNALQFICVQKLDEFENIRECIMEKILTGDVSSLLGYTRCQPSAPLSSSHSPVPDLCALQREFGCFGEVTGNVCGSQSGAVVGQLTDGILSDLGCSNDALSKLRRKGLEQVFGLFRRATYKK
jgi:hypothetical protein